MAKDRDHQVPQEEVDLVNEMLVKYFHGKELIAQLDMIMILTTKIAISLVYKSQSTAEGMEVVKRFLTAIHRDSEESAKMILDKLNSGALSDALH